jgi:arylsulfatase A-like enzyme
MRRGMVIGWFFTAAMLIAWAHPLPGHGQEKPNILVVWGDDVGQSNISAYTRGLVGYTTPNIDRIANEGVLFTDYYGEQSCTAGRSSFITGQSVFRTGLSKVGLPGADLGLRTEDPTIAALLKAKGYATGQFGKNHLGDKDEFLPTNHGFDEFFGNLYHLNAEEEPEHEDYPKNPEFRKKFGPRGVIHSWAQPGGKQKIEDTGPLTKKRMETVDDETSDRAIEFIREQHKAGKPWFVWWNGTRMHFRTHVKPELRGISGQDEYADGMVEHDMHIGKFLKLLDELGIADKTIVFYSTDNGPHYNTWPDAAITPWRSEKNSNWEGAYRVPCYVRWPGKFEAGKTLNGIVTHQEWLPTLLAAAGDPDIVEKLKKGHKAGEKTFHVHVDGYNILPYLTGDTDQSQRRFFYYANDDGQVVAIRIEDWKVVFMEQRAKGMMVWAEPFVPLRVPKIFNLRRDPFERADESSNTYWDWVLYHVPAIYAAQGLTVQQIQSFVEFPPRQKPASFNLDTVLEKLKEAADGGMR